ncbi:hypothetical protein ACWDRB_44660 [Nonomuraea sp. NPDC003707]
MRPATASLTDPARRDAVAIVRRGQADGVFHDHLPAEVLAPALGALMLSPLESVNAGLWEDSGPGAATAILTGAGVPPERAAGVAAGPAR